MVGRKVVKASQNRHGSIQFGVHNSTNNLFSKTKHILETIAEQLERIEMRLVGK